MSWDGIDELEVRELGEDDVPSLIACIRRCYGETYAEHEFYDAAYVRGELRAGRLISVGALDGTRIVGHVGTRVRGRGDVIAETVCGVVDPDYRGRGLIAQVGGPMTARYGELGIAGIMHFATGAHDRTQRPIVASGAVPTGVLLGHIAAETEYRGIEHPFVDKRIGVVVYVHMFGRLDALDVYVPQCYAEALADLYEQLALDRRVFSHNDAPRSLQTWRGSAQHDAHRGISLLRFGALADAATVPAIELVDHTVSQCHTVAYADVPIADPRGLDVIARLAQTGFCFGALLPGTARTEAIRLQRLRGAAIEPHAIVTADSYGRSLLEWIIQQHQSVTPQA